MACYFGVLAVFVVCLFNIQDTTSCSCFIPKDSCVYQTCGCPITPSGIVACTGCPCDTCNSCSIMPTSYGCSSCDSCFRDTACPCTTCPEKPSPVCSCLKSLESEPCSCRKRIYFPEVEYPNTILEMNPTFFGNCWRF